MRTDDQRDECLDLLLRRINDLENEIAELKGEPSFEGRTIVNRRYDQSTLMFLRFQNKKLRRREDYQIPPLKAQSVLVGLDA